MYSLFIGFGFVVVESSEWQNIDNDDACQIAGVNPVL